MTAAEVVALVDRFDDAERAEVLAEHGLTSLDHLRAVLALRRGRPELWRAGHALPPESLP